jgi:short-subunit dehydrogenase
MKQLNTTYGPWALITGASSGIGETFARALAARGLNLVLAARRNERLRRLAAELEAAHSIETRLATVDLSRPDFFEHIAPVVAPLEVGLLVNNAGFALTGPFVGGDLAHHEKLLDVNCRAPLVLTHHLAGQMASRGRGGIINVASLAGFLPMPAWSSYAASKAFLLHFSEGLSHELSASGVAVLALCPGATKTEFAGVAGITHGGMAREEVVSAALRGLGRKACVIPGRRNWLVAFLTRLVSRRKLTRIGAAIVNGMRPGRDRSPRKS